MQKLIEQKMNDFIVSNSFYGVIFDELEFFYELSLFFKKQMDSFIHDIKPVVDYKQMTKISFQDKINIINAFYKKNNIDIDINKIIADGTIQLYFYDHFYDNEESLKKKVNNLFLGTSVYDGEHKAINVVDNGFVTDILVLVHEISHYRNQPLEGRTIVNKLFTETLAYCDELIVADYLCSLGYENEIKQYLKLILTNLYNLLNNQNSLYRMFIVYKNLGAISLDNYKYLYDNESNYGEDLNYLTKNINNLKCLFDDTFYILALALSPTLYLNYKENGYKNIQPLYDLINQNNSLSVFEKIGFKNLDTEDLKKMFEALKVIINSFNNKEEKLTTDTINVKI